MAWAGLGRGLALIAAREDDALAQSFQPTGEMRAIFGEQICGELID
jgi:hypothetical protein